MKITALEIKHLEQFIYFRKISNNENAMLNNMSREQFIDMMNYRKEGMSFVLVKDKDIVGQLFLDNQNKNIHIQLISVLKSVEGTGAGKMLLMHVEKVCKMHNCNTITLMVKITNKRAIEFYERNGFVKVAQYKSDCRYRKLL